VTQEAAEVKAAGGRKTVGDRGIGMLLKHVETYCGWKCFIPFLIFLNRISTIQGGAGFIPQ